MRAIAVVLVTVVAAIGLSPGSTGMAQTPDLYVIVGAGVSLSAADVREVYLGEKQFSGSLRLVPVDNAAARATFLARVLSLSPEKYETVWTKKAFRDAVNPPRVLPGNADILEFVRRTPGAVGYVSIVPTGVAVIRKY